MTSAGVSGVGIAEDEARALLDGYHASPHAVLGCHPATIEGQPGAVLRALHPHADRALAEVAGRTVELARIAHRGVFGAFVPGLSLPQFPRLTFHFPDGARWSLGDPYSHWPTLGDHDLYLFGEGNHFGVWDVLGARAREHQGILGTAFAVWAPNAVAAALVSDFNGWDRGVLPMRAMGSSGIFELFVPGLAAGTRYQFDLLTRAGHWIRKSDPFAEAADHPPGRASKVTAKSGYLWGDEAYMAERAAQDLATRPVNVYEVHLGSFRRHADGRVLTYRELADALVPHMAHFGFTHLELLPVNEHPFDGSWGYQVTGFYAPTARYGTPDDFRYLVDTCHQRGIGVILDWVPAHFPKDDFALARFDGTPLYEHADPRQGEHPDWGTLIFNYGRKEVANFLIGSALYFLTEFHIDGLRVDAVASMLYLDYSRPDGGWVPNPNGGRENLEAIAFLRRLNQVIAERCPGCYAIAEESTAWGGVTGPVEHGGLGFALKWNMGWMHDTLLYFSKDPVHRRFHQNDLTFATVYEHTERFLMPLSHDEVVHGKGSLLARMPGDPWQRFANLRVLYAYQYTRPGKKLLFMGSEFAPDGEWNHAIGLPWPPAKDTQRQALMRFVAALGELYRTWPALYVDGQGGFAWIDTADHAQSVLSYLRAQGEQRLVIVMNLTPVPREAYRIGAPWPGRYRLVLNTDAPEFGGSGFPATQACEADDRELHGQDWSISLNLPPLSLVVLDHAYDPEHLVSHRLGIVDSYYTIDGTRHRTDSATRALLIELLGEPPQRAPSEPPKSPRPRVYTAEEALGGRRGLGLWTQLYTLRSERSWGIGDFGDLQRLLRLCGACGLDFVGLNPLHAMPFNANPAVPYHPWTRLYDTPLYIDVEAVPEVQAILEKTGPSPYLMQRREAVCATTDVSYAAVWELKRDVLRPAFALFQSHPPDHPRRRAAQAFFDREGESLRRFACFCAIQDERMRRGQPCGTLEDMGEDLRAWESHAVSAYMAAHATDIAFHCYLQFLVDEQLAACAAAARDAGMRIGLYLDLAVGAGHGGFDAWSEPQRHVPEVSVGAPPDDLAPQGQDWGLVPLHPLRLPDDDFAYLRLTLRRAMRHAGALRIDHAMGMERQYWIPRDHTLRGTYVAFPFAGILDVVAEESRAARCLVIAEDLGTVSEGFRPAITERGILRYEVLHFSRDPAGRYPAPEALIPQALLCLATHDLPTFHEFWNGTDLLLRRKMGVLSEDGLMHRVDQRMRDKAALCAWLGRYGMVVDESESAAEVLPRVHALLARGRSALVALSLDDLVGEPHAVNVPGTSPETGFTSFARRMARDLASLETDEAFQQNLRWLRALVDGEEPDPPSGGGA